MSENRATDPSKAAKNAKDAKMAKNAKMAKITTHPPGILDTPADARKD